MYQRLAAMIAEKRKQEYNHTDVDSIQVKLCPPQSSHHVLEGSRPKRLYQQDSHDHVEAIFAECRMGRAMARQGQVSSCYSLLEDGLFELREAANSLLLTFGKKLRRRQ